MGSQLLPRRLSLAAAAMPLSSFFSACRAKADPADTSAKHASITFMTIVGELAS
jgi:hypothetical protein